MQGGLCKKTKISWSFSIKAEKLHHKTDRSIYGKNRQWSV